MKLLSYALLKRFLHASANESKAIKARCRLQLKILIFQMFFGKPISRTFEALNQTPEMQEFSRVFKTRTNPVSNGSQQLRYYRPGSLGKSCRRNDRFPTEYSVQ